MNSQRRKELRTILDSLTTAARDLEGIRDDEEVYRDNIPENLRESRNYEKADDAACALDDACNALGEIFELLECAIE